MKRYAVQYAITGNPVGKAPYATQQSAERAAGNASQTSAMSVEVWWLNDTGRSTVLVAYAYRGEVTRTPESPVS